MEKNRFILIFRCLFLAALVFFTSVGDSYALQLQLLHKQIDTLEVSETSHQENGDKKEEAKTVISETVLVNHVSSGTNLLIIAKNMYKLFDFLLPIVKDFEPKITSIPSSLLDYYIVLIHYIIAPHAP